MKKLLIILGILAALGVVGVVVLTFFLGNIVTAGINNFGPKLTQTKVTLASARISPLTGSGTLSGLVVGNPKGWSENDLCSLGKVHLSVAPFSLLGDHIVVNEIDIEAPEFNYETKIVASNVKDLLKAIEATMGGSKDTAAPQPGATTTSGKAIKFEVKKFRLKNGRVRLGVAGTGMTLPMSDIELTDLGTKEGGITPDQLVFAVMKSVTGSIVSATAKAAGDIGKTSGAAAAEGAKKTVEGIKSLFGGKK
ncbi:MAG: hypothetical protein EXS37_00245 [Opitutus sp.]|nr:hypothetical protein [Opitutus sp.]